MIYKALYPEFPARVSALMKKRLLLMLLTILVAFAVFAVGLLVAYWLDRLEQLPLK